VYHRDCCYIRECGEQHAVSMQIVLFCSIVLAVQSFRPTGLELMKSTHWTSKQYIKFFPSDLSHDFLLHAQSALTRCSEYFPLFAGTGITPVFG
jgi:hypothetical protein